MGIPCEFPLFSAELKLSLESNLKRAIVSRGRYGSFGMSTFVGGLAGVEISIVEGLHVCFAAKSKLVWMGTLQRQGLIHT